MRFRQKAVKEIEAIQWLGDIEALKPFADKGMRYLYDNNSRWLVVDTAAGQAYPHLEDWIILNDEGKFMLCHDALFKNIYEKVEDEE